MAIRIRSNYDLYFDSMFILICQKMSHAFALIHSIICVLYLLWEQLSWFRSADSIETHKWYLAAMCHSIWAVKLDSYLYFALNFRCHFFDYFAVQCCQFNDTIYLKCHNLRVVMRKFRISNVVNHHIDDLKCIYTFTVWYT